MPVMLCGTGVSRGIAIARVRVYAIGSRAPVQDARAPGSPAQERERLLAALERVRAGLREICHRAGEWPEEVQTIIEGHLRLVEDDAFASPAIRRIDALQCSAENALDIHRRELLGALAPERDPHLRARRAELAALFDRLMSALVRADTHEGAAPQAATAPAGETDGDYVLVCADPAPADLLTRFPGRLVGLVSERGGQLSHTTIVARSLRLPYVAGLTHATTLLRQGDTIIVDGQSGLVLADPQARTLALFRERQRAADRNWERLSGRPGAGPARTADGVPVEILTNVRGPADLTLTRRMGADGVGLYRTEFLFANRDDLPSEEEHYESYRRLCQGMGGAPVTIRTVDVCAGPSLRGLGVTEAVSPQPALGLRAIRLCLAFPEQLFEPQLRAILRAGAHGAVRILLPMVATVAELEGALALIDKCRRDLHRAGKAYGASVPVGVMIEVPAAAVCAEAFARRAAFLSIGTNDLTQYTLAIDRDDESVQTLYDPVNPAVLRLIRASLAAGRRAGVPVSLCGEMAGDPRYTRLLLGLGLTSFSMGPISVPEVRQALAATRVSAVRPLARRILTSDSVDEAARLLAELNRQGPALESA